MKKTACLLITLAFLLSGVGAKAVYAGPRLYFDPASATKNLNETFTVTAKVDTAGEIVGSIDGIGTYDSSKLELVSVTKASDMVFNEVEGGGNCQIPTSSGGRFTFSCYTNSVLSNTVPAGSLVVFTFKAIAVGTGTVNFSCTAGSTVDSNIVKSSNASDVISCSENGAGSYTVVQGSTTTTTTNPTTNSSTTTTSTTLPQTGSFGVTLGVISFGLVSVLSAIFLKFL